MARIFRGAAFRHCAVSCPCAAFALFSLIFTLPAGAGTLTLGTPSVENGQYTFPVLLNGADNQVSALDFRVQFDPSIFQPISAVAGNAALAANKMVSANYANPGEYVVVMMGLNQTAVPAGQVASVVMQRVGTDSALAKTQLSITDPTLATPDGSELNASGSTVQVALNGEQPATDATETPKPETGDAAATPPTATPATPASAPATGTATPKRPMTLLAGAPADNAARPTPPGTPAAGNPTGTGGSAPGTTPAGAPESGNAGGENTPLTTVAQAGNTNSTNPNQMLHNMPAPGSIPPRQPMTQTANAPKIESERNEGSVASPLAANAAEGTPATADETHLFQYGAIAFVAVVVITAGWRRRRQTPSAR